METVKIPLLNFSTPEGIDIPWHLTSADSTYKFSSRCLGTGHFGSVLLATHRTTGEQRAIKCLDKAHPDYNAIEVCNEVEILSKVCDHPNIATLYEVYEDSTYVYLVEEACLGGELFDVVVERKHFSEGDAARAAAIMLDVIKHCHRHGIIHRDIKPENFLLKTPVPGGQLKFQASNLRAVDFGLSVHLDAHESTVGAVGSAYYIAPEMLLGLRYGLSVDAWSIGVVVFILISGYPPFFGPTDSHIYHRIIHQELDMDYEPWNTGSVSKEAADFVGRLLIKDAASRMTIEEAIQHPWIVKATLPESDVPLPPLIIDRLHAFTREKRITCLLMTLVAHYLTDVAINDLRQRLNALDEEGNGLVSVDNLTWAVRRATGGSDGTIQGISALIEQLDIEHVHPGKVHIDEFLAAALDRRALLSRAAVVSVFERLDSDGDGKLTVGALSRGLEDCGLCVPEELLSSLMAREGALDGKGVISMNSFENLLALGAEEQGEPATSAFRRSLRRFESSSSSEGFEVEGTEENDVILHQRTPGVNPCLSLAKATLRVVSPKTKSTTNAVDYALQQCARVSGYCRPRLRK